MTAYAGSHRARALAGEYDQQIIDRFWAKVDRRGADECWPWKAGTYHAGHGRFAITHTHSVPAHRFCFAITNGGIKAGVNALHSCDNPPCCNPDHLWKGTLNDNVQDAVKKRRHAFGEKIGNSKLTTEQVRAIRVDGRISEDIAADYGVHRSLISYIKTGKVWGLVK